MKTLLFALSLLFTSLQALSLDDVIEKSLANSPSLEVINARIEANKYAIDVAKQFENPQLLITSNTLTADEKMHQQVLSLQQEIPFYGKRDAEEKIDLAEDAILKQKLQSAKVQLVADIKNEAYTIWELQELYEITEKYIELTEQNIALYESYTSIDSSQHMGIMKAELSLCDLKIQQSSLRSQLTSAYARVSYLAAFTINELDIELSMGNLPKKIALDTIYGNNPELAIKEKELLKESAKVTRKELNNYPDIKLLAGYAYRENYSNYVNFGVALSLPLYGTEESKTEEARALKLSVKSQEGNTKLLLNAQLKVYYAQMQAAYEIYHIVQDDALIQVAHMFELSSSSISTGGDLFKYIDVLFQKLSLEQKSIVALANYKRAQAKIAQLSGALQ